MRDLTVRIQCRYADGTLETQEWLHIVKMEKQNDFWHFLDDQGYEHMVVASTVAHLDVFAVI